MPERSQSLIRTRCPECATIFRVTSVQLRQKAGTVRCGHCQALFNAFDHLLRQHETLHPPEPPPVVTGPPALIPASGPEAVVETEIHAQPSSPPELVPAEPEASPGEPFLASPPEEPISVGEPDGALSPIEFLLADEAEAPYSPVFEPLPVEPLALALEDGGGEQAVASAVADIELLSSPLPPVADLPEVPAEPVVADDMLPAEEQSTEATTQAARDAGLVAARELVDTASYNRWSEGFLAGNGIDNPLDPAAKPPRRWPYVLLALLLSAILLVQLAYYFRSEIVIRWPVFAEIYQASAVDVPLPKNSDLVAIEASDLQSDPGRGLFILQATLKNRAAYAQDWPALELTLTDINEAVVARRVIDAVDYLPPEAAGLAFEANGERAVRLSIEAKDLGASGYRLYLFYH